MELETLAIEKTSFSLNSLKYLVSIFNSCTNIISLTLEDIVSMDNLTNQEFTFALVDTLASLTHMKQLRSLNISRNHLKNEFFNKFAPILQTTKIEVLDVSGNSISDEGFLYLCPYIKGNQYLRELNLNYSKFKAETPA